MDEWVDMRRENIWLRWFTMGPTGSGKTKGVLEVATKLSALLDDIPVVLIDTQHGQAKVYADQYAAKYSEMVDDFSPEAFIAKMDSAEQHFPGGILIIDGISQEWNGKNGVQTIIDRFGGWKEGTPRHDAFVERMMTLQMHLLVTCRAKMKFSVSEAPRTDGSGGTRQVIEKLGLGPEQREGMMYEFDILAMIDQQHVATFSNRCEPLTDTTRSLIPGDEIAEILAGWLAEGDPPQPPEEADEADVAELTLLLHDEGKSQALIEEKFAIARRQNRGKLHPDYILDQLTKARQRAEKKAAASASKTEPIDTSAPQRESDSTDKSAPATTKAKQESLVS